MEQQNLHKFRIYPDDPKLPAVSNNLTIELDGKKLKGVIEFIYKANGTDIPTVDIKMMADVDLNVHGKPNIRKLDSGQDMVEF